MITILVKERENDAKPEKTGGRNMSILMPVLRNNSLMTYPVDTLFESFFDDFMLPDIFTKEKEWLPSVDISENDTEFMIRAEVPGMDKNDLNITLTDGLLTIKGEKKKESEERKENYHRVESHYGSFTRTLKLPGEIETDKINANYKDGVLKITVPKAEKAEAKKITVN